MLRGRFQWALGLYIFWTVNSFEIPCLILIIGTSKDRISKSLHEFFTTKFILNSLLKKHKKKSPEHFFHVLWYRDSENRIKKNPSLPLSNRLANFMFFLYNRFSICKRRLVGFSGTQICGYWETSPKGLPGQGTGF